MKDNVFMSPSPSKASRDREVASSPQLASAHSLGEDGSPLDAKPQVKPEEPATPRRVLRKRPAPAEPSFWVDVPPSPFKRSKTTAITYFDGLACREDVLAEFIDWMFSRHLILLGRINDPEQKNGPWIKNEKVMTQRSCNVFRELDSGTQYLLDKVINHQETASLEELVFQTALFKVFNKPETWERLTTLVGGPPTYAAHLKSPGRFLKAFNKIKQEGLREKYNLTTGAYQCTAPKLRKTESDHQAKLRIVSDMMNGKKRKGLKNEGSLAERLRKLSDGTLPLKKGQTVTQAAFEEVRNYPLMGEFIAQQQVLSLPILHIAHPFLQSRLLLDLSYLPGIDLDFDRDAFIAFGPGSRSGLNLIMEDEGTINLSPSEREDIKINLSAKQRRLAIEHIVARLDGHWDSIRLDHSRITAAKTLPEFSLPPTLLGSGRKIGLVEVEHALCEFHKYKSEEVPVVEVGKGKGKKAVPVPKKVRGVVSVDLPHKYLTGKSLADAQ